MLRDLIWASLGALIAPPSNRPPKNPFSRSVVVAYALPACPRSIPGASRPPCASAPCYKQAAGSAARARCRHTTHDGEGEEEVERGAAGVRGSPVGGRRQAPGPHGRRRVQTRRPGARVPQVHLGRLRGTTRPSRGGARCRSRGRRRVPERGRLLGAKGGP